MSERIPFTDKYGYDELKNMVMNIQKEPIYLMPKSLSY